MITFLVSSCHTQQRARFIKERVSSKSAFHQRARFIKERVSSKSAFHLTNSFE